MRVRLCVCVFNGFFDWVNGSLGIGLCDLNGTPNEISIDMREGRFRIQCFVLVMYFVCVCFIFHRRCLEFKKIVSGR